MSRDLVNSITKYRAQT